MVIWSERAAELFHSSQCCTEGERVALQVREMWLMMQNKGILTETGSHGTRIVLVIGEVRRFRRMCIYTNVPLLLTMSSNKARTHIHVDVYTCTCGVPDRLCVFPADDS